MVPTCATASVVVTLIEISSSFLTIAATVLSIPFLISIGLAPAATFFNPSRAIAWVKTVTVVVPSPAISLVFWAPSLSICTPWLAKASSTSIDLATVTPSFVTVGALDPLAIITFFPDGPNVTLTESARMLTPCIIFSRACTSNKISLDIYFSFCVFKTKANIVILLNNIEYLIIFWIF